MASIRKTKKELKRILRNAKEDQARIGDRPASLDNIMAYDAMGELIKTTEETLRNLKQKR